MDDCPYSYISRELRLINYCGGYVHSNAETYNVVDAKTIKGYGFDQVDAFFENSLFFDAVDPALEAKMLKEFERIKSGF